MTQIKGLTTNFREELPQRGTGIHMAPAFRSLRELDDWHRVLGFVSPSLFPCAANAMTSDSLGIGKLSLKLTSKISNDGWAEEVRVVHLRCATGLDHINIKYLPVLLLRDVYNTNPLA